jgi:hypothetical protein
VKASSAQGTRSRLFSSSMDKTGKGLALPLPNVHCAVLLRMVWALDMGRHVQIIYRHLMHTPCPPVYPGTSSPASP